MRFCKDQGPGAQILAEFIEEVATFRCGSAITSSAALAKQIQNDYVVIDSVGRSEDSPQRRRIGSIVRHLPSYNSTPGSPRSNRSTTQALVLNPENLNVSQASQAGGDPNGSHADSSSAEASDSKGDGSSMISRRPNPKWSQHMDLDLAKNAIKVVGEPVDRVVLVLQDINPFDSKNGAVIRVPADVFDELDEIVFSYLRDAYFESFKHSSWWTKVNFPLLILLSLLICLVPSRSQPSLPPASPSPLTTTTNNNIYLHYTHIE